MITTLSYIIATLWFIVILRWDLLGDLKKWRNNIPVKHAKEAVLRFLLLLPTFALLLWPKLYTSGSYLYIVVEIIITTGLIFSVWWELFDGVYNKMRGFKWRFNGSMDKDDSFFDRVLYRLTDTQEAVLKLSLITTFLLSYIFTK